jgi:hypothetical protein
LDYFLERVADKVIFGSNWLVMPYLRRNIELVRGLPLEGDAAQNPGRQRGVDSGNDY